jgi:hypothetical protein
MPPLVQHTDQQEERAGRNSVVDLLDDAAGKPDAALSAKMPSVQKPKWLTEL